jgi:hypothetical protein
MMVHFDAMATIHATIELNATMESTKPTRTVTINQRNGQTQGTATSEGQQTTINRVNDSKQQRNGPPLSKGNGNR